MSEEDKRSWLEDLKHENGNYECICRNCNKTFIGHKRRQICKICSRDGIEIGDIFYSNESFKDYEVVKEYVWSDGNISFYLAHFEGSSSDIKCLITRDIRKRFSKTYSEAVSAHYDKLKWELEVFESVYSKHLNPKKQKDK